MDDIQCRGCGCCCKNVGLVPPVLRDCGPGLKAEGAPEWLEVLVVRLWKLIEDEGLCVEDYPCVFLTKDRRCAIHAVFKPRICRNYGEYDGDCQGARVHYLLNHVPGSTTADKLTVEGATDA